MKLSHFLGALVVSCSITVLAVCLLAPVSSPVLKEVDQATNDPRSASPEDRRVRRAVGLPETSFRIGGPVSLTARSSKQTSSDERLVLFELSADAAAETKAAPVNLAIVMDRSGSMQGARIENAKRAAQAAIAKLRVGDRLAVVTFDTRAERVFVGEIDRGTTRSDAARAVEGIRLGGDTCISCGLDLALPWLAGADGVRRVVLLSDGDANNGVRDLDGFRALGDSAAKAAATITSVGLDVHYNEKILSALSEASNGRHIFSDRPEDLADVFGDEASRLAASVADQAEVRFTLPRSVELVAVADRAFTREGNVVRVALGALSRGEKKTILVRLRTRGVDTEGLVTDFRYVDAVSGQGVSHSATIGLTTQDELDPAVTERAARSEAAAALREANELMDAGRFDEARARLGAARTAIAATASAPSMATAMATATAVASDFDRQLDTLQRAEQSLPLATSRAASSSRALQSQKKKNWTASRELGF